MKQFYLIFGLLTDSNHQFMTSTLERGLYEGSSDICFVTDCTDYPGFDSFQSATVVSLEIILLL